MTKAEAIVWLTEAREARESARAAWNYSGDEIKTLEAALDAAKAKNAELRFVYYCAWSAAEAAKSAFNKTCRAERAVAK